MRKKVFLCMLVLVIALSLIAAGCGGGGESEDKASDGDKPTIVVGSKTFTEALLLGTMTYQYLDYLGYPVDNKVGLGELAVIRPALESGQVSAYWEYTGTVLINIMEHEPSFDEEESFKLVKEFDEANGIIWLDYTPMNDTYAIMVRQDVADKYNLTNTSDLTKAVQDGAHLKFITAQEWIERPDGLQHFESVYGFQYPKEDVVAAALNMSYEALKSNQAEVGLAFTTDARIEAYKLVALEDDKHAFPVYNAAPLFRQEILDAYPDIPEQMKKLSQLLDNDTTVTLNKAVDVDKKSVEEVSKQFLTEQGLIK